MVQSRHLRHKGLRLNASYIGELAALATAALWSFSSILFTIGGRRVGSMIVNRARLAFAVLFVGGMHWVLFGQPFPTGAESYRYAWFALSALIGLVIGDGLLFQCYVLVGPRLGVLLLSMSPVFSTALAWIFLGERLTPQELAAMAVALAGVTWVVLERGRSVNAQEASGRTYAIGILFGLGAALCQAANLVTAKQGLAGGFPALSATMIRMTFAAFVMWAWAAVIGEFGRTIRKVRADGQAARAIFGGAFIGPFLGVWLSMIAVQSSRVGIASTLMAMTPVLSLPLVRIVFKERVTLRAVLGTLIAMTGVAAMILL
jgi:drug/metabolite transporter (DMT)-like permease